VIYTEIKKYYDDVVGALHDDWARVFYRYSMRVRTIRCL